MTRALIVVDVQEDFCEGGAAPVAGGARIASEISVLLHHWTRQDPKAPPYDVVVATRTDVRGEAFHPNLDPQPFAAIFLKDATAAASSGFEGRTKDGAALADWLRSHEVTEIDLCGIATDEGVRATALDAARRGFETRVLVDLCTGTAADTTAAALGQMQAAGVSLA
jgi:nicotinamidase/pyrazinamidase